MSPTLAPTYALSFAQAINALRLNGHKRTTLFEGDMGIGKSSMLSALAAELPEHTPCYFDCTTKDLGDIMIPKLADAAGADYVTFATNEELGVHINKPVIIMIDEYGKANPMVQNALLRLMLERKLGSYTLHPDSVVFATTNLGAEGVGDMLKPHARNRITVVRMRKPDADEWLRWGVNNGIDPSVLGWIKDTPHALQSFTDVKNPQDNPYIYHPREHRDAFVTPRSLEAASDWIKQRDRMDEHTLTALLIGTIGAYAAQDMAAFIALADKLPSLESIKKNPETAKLPDDPSALCMVVYRTLATIDEDWIDAWMTYLERMQTEAQALFANGVRVSGYARQAVVMSNNEFQQWALAHRYMYAPDKK